MLSSLLAVACVRAMHVSFRAVQPLFMPGTSHAKGAAVGVWAQLVHVVRVLLSVAVCTHPSQLYCDP